MLGVNNSVDSVWRQEKLKLEYPPEKRLTYRVALKEVTEEVETEPAIVESPKRLLSPTLELKVGSETKEQNLEAPKR